MALSTYPYLGMSLAMLVLLLGGTLAHPRQRRMALLSGALQAPLGFLSVFFVPGYWVPNRLTVFGAGVEDLLFSFASGGLVWLLATVPLGRGGDGTLEPRRIFGRYAAFALPSIGAGALLWWLGFGAMNATFVVGSAATLVLAWRHRRALHLSLVGALGFGILYGTILKGSYWLWPEFPAQWTAAGSWGIEVWELPLEEIAWAAGGGAAWPLFVTDLTASRPT